MAAQAQAQAAETAKTEAELWSAARQKWPRRAAKAERVDEALGHYLEWLKQNFDLRLVMLFGSYADGTFRMDSDVDVLIVADQLSHNEPRRHTYPEDVDVKFPAKLQTFPYSPSEFVDMCKDDNAIAYSALTEGRVLYVDPDYSKKLTSVL